MQKNILENLEIKLKNARVENQEKFEKFEKIYNKDYKEFLDWFFKSDILWAKKIASATFQLELLNWKTEKMAFEKWVENAVSILPLQKEKKEKTKKNILFLLEKKWNIEKRFLKNKEIQKDHNFPIIESLFKRKILSLADMMLIASNFEKTKKISASLSGLETEKKLIIKEEFFLISSQQKEKNIESFKNEYFKELKKIEKKYWEKQVKKIIFFVGKNFFKAKAYKKNLESKKLRLRRAFKIAVLKLLKIKYLGFDIEELIRKINSMQDFEQMLDFIARLMDIIPENKEFIEDYELVEKIDETEELISEAEKNKKKILLWEKTTVKICNILDKTEKKLDKKLLEKILDEKTDIVWNEIITRWEKKQEKKQSKNIWNLLDWWNIKILNEWILAENNNIEENEEENFEELKEEDLELLYNELKLEFSLLDKQKTNFLINNDFENLDNTVEKLTALQIKLDKLDKILEKIV